MISLLDSRAIGALRCIATVASKRFGAYVRPITKISPILFFALCYAFCAFKSVGVYIRLLLQDIAVLPT